MQAPAGTKAADVLSKLRKVIDPDFNEDIVKCGFIKQLDIDESTASVSITIELTTPACPVKEVFKNQSTTFVKVRRHAH